MFMPTSSAELNRKANDEEQRRKAYERIERWAHDLVPPHLRHAGGSLEVYVQEAQCGDPNCAPIDTTIAVLFTSGGGGMIQIPLEARKVTRAVVEQSFPREEILKKWSMDKAARKKREEVQRRMKYKKIEQWSLDLIPPFLCLQGVVVRVQQIQRKKNEVPKYSPSIETLVAIGFPKSGGGGVMSLPLVAKDVTRGDVMRSFPSEEVLGAWSRGEEAAWPPPAIQQDVEMKEATEDPPPSDSRLLPLLRFPCGTQVECKVGPDEWAAGEVVKLWYRAPNWPPSSMAPYQIRLDDGRFVFAPSDVDEVIRELVLLCGFCSVPSISGAPSLAAPVAVPGSLAPIA